MSPADVKPETSPSLFMSQKTGRGKLTGNWRQTTEPVMCAYKLVTVHFKWFGLQNLVEKFAHNVCYPFFDLKSITKSFSNIPVYFLNFTEKYFVGLIIGLI